MAERYIRDGRTLRVDAVHRGDLLVYPEEEWSRRADIESRRAFVVVAKILLLVVIAPLALLILSLTVPSMSFLDHRLFAVVVGVTVAVLGGMMASIARRRRMKLAVPGLYEEGIELPAHVFLPYQEVGTVGRGRVDNRMDGRYEVVHLFRRGVEEPRPFVDGRSVRVEFLGPEGMSELKRRLERARRQDRVTTPPDIRVYGSREHDLR